MIKVDRRKQREEAMDIERRVYNRNVKAMNFCNENELVIYPSAQAHSSSIVKLFVQKGEIFKPLNGIEYDQTKPAEVKAYIAAIDKEYERLYMKMKDRDDINK
tara:strand:- start:4355 stop:4663 length:309 start_codon:yes stop_codon:yes gene_type:complete